MTSLAVINGSGPVRSAVRLSDAAVWFAKNVGGQTRAVFVGDSQGDLRASRALGANERLIDVPGGVVVFDPSTKSIRELSIKSPDLGAPSNIALDGPHVVFRAGGGHSFFVDETKGKIAEFDDVSHSASRFIETSGAVAEAVVDGAGRLWASLVTGDLWSLAPGAISLTRVTIARPPGPPALRLVRVGDTAYALDASTGQLVRLHDGSAGSSVNVAALAGSPVITTVRETSAAGGALLVTADAVLKVDTGSGAARRILVKGLTTNLGEAIESAGLVVIPDDGTASVVIVDTVSGHVRSVPVDGAKPNDRLEVKTSSGTVWATDPQSPIITVARPGGATVTIDTSLGNTNPGPGPNSPSTGATGTGGPGGASGGGSGGGASGGGTGGGTGPATKTTVPPGLPTNVGAAPGDGLAYVTWGAPTSGGPAEGFDIAWRVVPAGSSCPPAPYGDGSTRVGVGGATQVSNLQNGTPYCFSVTGFNRAGTGPTAATASPTAPSNRAPQQPLAVAAVPDGPASTAPNGSVVIVTWKPPSDSGRIDHYVVTYARPSFTAESAGSQVGKSGALTQRLLGLSADVVYRVRVYGIAADGTRSVPGEAQVTPVAPPVKPTITAVAPDANKLTVNWIQPAGGSPVEQFDVFADGTRVTTVAGNATSADLTSVTNGEAHTVYLVSRNKYGSAQSDPKTGTPGKAPQLSNLQATKQSVQDFVVSWTGNFFGQQSTLYLFNVGNQSQVYTKVQTNASASTTVTLPWGYQEVGVQACVTTAYCSNVVKRSVDSGTSPGVRCQVTITARGVPDPSGKPGIGDAYDVVWQVDLHGAPPGSDSNGYDVVVDGRDMGGGGVVATGSGSNPSYKSKNPGWAGVGSSVTALVTVNVSGGFQGICRTTTTMQ